MKTSTLVLLCTCAVILVVDGKGLREEFTWTRISYALPQGLGGESGGNRNDGQNGLNGSNGQEQSDNSAIAFPGATAGGAQGGSGGSYGGSYGGRTGRRSRVPRQSRNSRVDYNYVNNIPMGANRWNDKLFITVPRRRLGVPSTLNYVSIRNKGDGHNVPLIPYPDYETNAFESSRQRRHRIVSVYRVAIDPCDRMWFVDTGVIELPGNATQIQPPALVIIDLTTDTIIQRHEFPNSVLRNSPMANIEVDVTSDNCRDAFAYVPDVGGFGIVVYDLRNNRSWRVSHNYFYLESLAGEFFVGGLHFQWNDGIFSIALSDVKRDGYRDAYFHSMAGTHLFRVSTRVLKNETLATRSYHENDFEIVGDRGDDSQTSASDLHQPSGVLFLGLVNRNALGCWNTNKEFKLRNFDVVQRDNRRMIYPCDVKVYRDDVILLTNSMPVFLYSRLNYDEVNFRVWMNSVEEAVEGTYCKG